MARVLPPGLAESDFDAAIARFKDVVGDKYVVTEAGDLARYRDPYPVGSEPAAGASAAVSPETTEQVQEIVRIANEYGIPLSPISTGRNNGYGGGQPRLSGAVVINTGERMGRILEVNEKYGYALLEPGVSYFDRYDHLQAHAPTLMLDCPDLGWGSVEIVDQPDEAVLVLACRWEEGLVITAHNLSQDGRTVEISVAGVEKGSRLVDLWEQRSLEEDPTKKFELQLDGYGYRWLRVQSEEDHRLY